MTKQTDTNIEPRQDFDNESLGNIRQKKTKKKKPPDAQLLKETSATFRAILPKLTVSTPRIRELGLRKLYPAKEPTCPPAPKGEVADPASDTFEKVPPPRRH